MSEVGHLLEVISWMTGRDCGASSKAIALVMVGAPPDGQYLMEPGDVDDLGRCMRLLKRFPEWRPRMGLMKPVSRHWSALVDEWHRLEAYMLQELGPDFRPAPGRRAPKTRALMERIEKQARQA